MQVNLPDRGVFKGIGSLEKVTNINRKIFPNIRNAHQFEFDHGHSTNYETTFTKFYAQKKDTQNNYHATKPNKWTNQSQIILGSDQKYIHPYLSLNRQNFPKYQNLHPSKLMKHKEEGIGFGQNRFVSYQNRSKKERGKKIIHKQFNPYDLQSINKPNPTFTISSKNQHINQSAKSTNFVIPLTTTKDHFCDQSKLQYDNKKYKFTRNQRFNPINGKPCKPITTYAFEDFNQGKKNNYKANNFTKIEKGIHVKEDIITGRMINY